MLVRSVALTGAIRREILAVLARPAMTMPAATAQVALGWGDRRRRHGESPSSVRAAEAIAFQVGADMAEEFAAHRAEEDSTRRGRRTPGSTGRPVIPMRRNLAGRTGQSGDWETQE